MTTTTAKPPKRVRKKLTRTTTPTREPDQYDPGIVHEIPIERLHRHPDNRTIPKASVTELAESLREHGQKEPLRVRELPDPIGHFEIISGERRFVAAGVVGLEAMKCIVESHDDSQTLVELAVANAGREDLDPIERAELMTKLMQPTDEGGAGMTREAAGKVFGLDSESGVKNALRLMQLPTVFQRMLRDKQLTVKQARALVPYASGQFLQKFHAWLTRTRQKFMLENVLEYGDEEPVEEALEDFLRSESRPADSLEKHYHGYQVGGSWPCLIDFDTLDAKKRSQLVLTEVPHYEGWGSNRKLKGTRLVSLAPKAWHKLQDPLVKAAHAAKQKKGTKGPKAKKGSKPKVPTAAELKHRAQQQEAQLDSYTHQWIRTALRCVIANTNEWPGGCVEYMLPWLLAKLARCNNSGELEKINAWAISECLPSPDKDDHDGTAKDAKRFCAQMEEIAIGFNLALWRIALWPSASSNQPHQDLAPGVIPDAMPTLWAEIVDELAAAVGVSAETVWQQATREGFPRELVRQWMNRHISYQVEKLAKELKVTIAKGKRADMVDALLSHHRPDKPLPMPKRIAKHAPSTDGKRGKGGRR